MANRVKGFEARRGGKVFAHQLSQHTALSSKADAQSLRDKFRQRWGVWPDPALTPTEQVKSRLNRSDARSGGVTYIDFADHAGDAIYYGATGMTGAPKALSEHTDAVLIMELLSRGYAVLKCPAPGEPPETLKHG